MDERRHNMDGALFVDEREDRRETTRRAHDDEKAEDARRVTQGILDRMDLVATATIREDDEEIVIDIAGEDAGRAIGKKGQTLEALQFLVNKIVNREPDARRHIVLDSGNYRERHDNSLISMAKREAKRAMQLGKVITLEPMSARDRRVIHVSLSKFTGVSTRSEGEGSDRRLQIIPAREGGRSGGGGRERGGRSGGGGRDRGPRDRDRGPPRDRGDAPRDRSDAPRDRSDAPRDRSDAPRDRSDAPRDRSDAPRDRSDAPRDRSEAPRDRNDAPRDREGSRDREGARDRDAPRDRESGRERSDAPREREASRDRSDAPGNREPRRDDYDRGPERRERETYDREDERRRDPR